MRSISGVIETQDHPLSNDTTFVLRRKSNVSRIIITSRIWKYCKFMHPSCCIGISYMLYSILSVVSVSAVILLYKELVCSIGYCYTDVGQGSISISLMCELNFIAIYCNNYMSSMVSIQRYLTPLRWYTSTSIHIETLGGHWGGTRSVHQSLLYSLLWYW